MNGQCTPIAAHIPFHLSDYDKTAYVHLVRSNPIMRATRDVAVPAKLVITAPHGYIFPDWSGIDDQVPTCN